MMEFIPARQLRKRKQIDDKKEDTDVGLVEEKRIELLPVPTNKTSSTQDSSENKKAKRMLRLNFCKTTIDLANFLLGKCLVRVFDGVRLIGRIVETEAYIGVTDPASHSYGEKRTERNKAMFMVAGTSYVYSIYGMYFCINISSRDKGGAVLIRALEPVEGIEFMTKNRADKRKETAPKLKTHQLCNGPSKLCQALKIDKTLNAVDMVSSNELYVLDVGEENEIEMTSVIACKRIGINGYGELAASEPYRFYIKGNKNVSVRDKTAEGNVTMIKQ